MIGSDYVLEVHNVYHTAEVSRVLGRGGVGVCV